MSHAVQKLQEAISQGMKIRPKVGGFPYLAETLRQAGVTMNRWSLPSCQALYLTHDGPVMMQGTPLINGVSDVSSFNQTALITALRTDQTGNSTFPEFLQSAWKAGCVSYDVDFVQRTVTYYGCQGEAYVEKYPEVDVKSI